MKRALILGAALAPLLAVGAQAGTNLVQNGSFSENTLPSPLHPSNASGAEIDSLWNYNGDLTDWSSVASPSNPQLYNILFTGTVAADTSINPDTRYTSAEPQYLNANFNSLSPDGGAFVGLDGDPNFTGALTQTILGLTIGQEYQLSFYWAGGELFNRTGYTSIQLTGSLGGDSFATPFYLNTNPAGTPASTGAIAGATSFRSCGGSTPFTTTLSM